MATQPTSTNYDTSKIFLFGNDYDKANYTAGSDITLAKGTVMGRILATNKVRDSKSDAVDGSQYPIGVLDDDYTIANGATKELSFCIKGWVDEGKLVFTKSGDGLTTSVGTEGKYKDLIIRNTGIILKPVSENTHTDNQ